MIKVGGSKNTEELIMTLTHVHEEEYRRLCREEGLEDGLERGLDFGRREVASNLLRMKVLTDQQIIEATGLSASVIEELKKEL